MLLRNLVNEVRAARVGASLSQQRLDWRSGAPTRGSAGRSRVGTRRSPWSIYRRCWRVSVSSCPIRAYPIGGGLRDAAQVRLLAAFRQLVTPTWGWATEVPMPIPGDLRAWDAVLARPVCRIGVDAESRIHDAQALDRRVMLKLRDSGVDRAIIVVPATRTNRSMLREFGSALRSNFPIGTSAALRALRKAVIPAETPSSSWTSRGTGSLIRAAFQRHWHDRPVSKDRGPLLQPIGGSWSDGARPPTYLVGTAAQLGGYVVVVSRYQGDWNGVGQGAPGECFRRPVDSGSGRSSFQ